jgi:hypothetical protein
MIKLNRTKDGREEGTLFLQVLSKEAVANIAGDVLADCQQ